MSKLVIPAILLASSTLAYADSDTMINGLDFGPLAQLAGTWKSTDTGGVDVAPGQEGSKVGKGGPAVEPFYETITFEPAADAKNASEQYLVAMYYKQEVFRKGIMENSTINVATLSMTRKIKLSITHTAFLVQFVL